MYLIIRVSDIDPAGLGPGPRTKEACDQAAERVNSIPAGICIIVVIGAGLGNIMGFKAEAEKVRGILAQYLRDKDIAVSGNDDPNSEAIFLTADLPHNGKPLTEEDDALAVMWHFRDLQEKNLPVKEAVILESWRPWKWWRGRRFLPLCRKAMHNHGVNHTRLREQKV